MEHSRIYCPEAAAVNQRLILSKDNSHYLTQVLRLSTAAQVSVFDGHGREFTAEIVAASKSQRQVTLQLTAEITNDANSVTSDELNITLVQLLPRPKIMDVIVQKATELGIRTIVPVIGSRTQGGASWYQKHAAMVQKLSHWRQISVNACCQCGRNQSPQINQITNLATWFATTALQQQSSCNIICQPGASLQLGKLLLHNSAPVARDINIILGPEGGFTAAELQLAQQHNFTAVRLAANVLRCETAAIAAMAALVINNL